MATAAGSQSRLLRVAEVTFGTTPATPTGIFTRFTGLSLAPTKDVFESKEIRSDRMTSDLRHGILMMQGDVDFELSAGGHDDMLESLMNAAWAADVLKIGTTRKSFSFEQGHPDITQYLQYTGVVVDKMSLSFVPGDIVTGKFSLLGKSADQATTSLFGTTSGPTTDGPMDTFSGFLKRNTVVVAVVTAVELEVNNGNETNKVIGSQSLQDIVAGRANVSGKLTAYFTDATFLNDFLDETEVTLEIQAAKGTKSYTFYMERCKFTGVKADVNKETSLTTELPFASLAPTSGTNTALRITRDLT